jgi:hypothetical protein
MRRRNFIMAGGASARLAAGQPDGWPVSTQISACNRLDAPAFIACRASAYGRQAAESCV